MTEVGPAAGPGSARTGALRRFAPPALVVAGPVAVALADTATDLRVFPSLLCLLAIGGAAALGGRWYGLAAALTSFIAFNFFFTQPHRSFEGTDWESVAAGVLFGITAISISWLISRESRARAAGEQARRAAEASSARAQRLQLLAGALAEAYTPQQVLDATLSEGVTAADARAGLLAAVAADGTQLEVIAQRGYEEELVGRDGRWARFPLDADLPLSETVRTMEPVFINSRQERDERYPLLRDTARESHAMACLPLVLEGEAFGGMVFSFARDHVLDDERRQLKIAIANQVAQALARARLLEVANAAQARAAFLAEASALLASSLDYEQTLARLAQLAVPGLADWCSIDMAGPQGSIERLTVAHQDPEKVAWAQELQQRFPPNPDEPRGAANVLRTGEPELMAQIPQELLDGVAAERPELAEVIEQLGLRSWICVPLRARGTTLGALSLVAAESGRTFTEADLELALELANRAAVAVDNARLFRESESRGNAARALEFTADGVALVDESGCVRYWNPAAAAITGVPVEGAVGSMLADVLPAWEDVDRHVVAAPVGSVARPTTFPLPRADGDRWVSVTAVEFDEGAVYAIRDVTAERALEQARSDFVATASHELRTPIAAVYGAVRTLRRPDVEFSEEDKEIFLQIIETEGERLGSLVEQILVAGQIDAGTVRVNERPVDIVALADAVVASARVRAPDNVQLVLDANGNVPPLKCDEDKLRQVLVNLVENAVKYSPDGGTVRVEIGTENSHGRIAVHDEGLGIPADEQRRIFEKFFRLDPSLTRGVGGSGLGLYISRELVDRMHGRLTVTSEPGRGSTFTVELPVA